MIGHAFSRVAAEMLFAPRIKSETRKESRALLPMDPGFGGKTNFLHGFVVNRVLRCFYIWQDRAEQRANLLSLDERMLKDIGITRNQATQEARKPFWMA
jgi:uncharacterized protein YjiS (DUF1127 family)